MKIIQEGKNVYLVLKEEEEKRPIRCNSTDASVEKHLPQLNHIGDKVEVVVNHVMEEKHYIEWILVDYGSTQVIQHFQPGEEAKLVVEYQENMKVYSYCNIHGLWINES